MTEPPMYERSPEEWANYLAEGNATQPRKRVAADALIRDDTGRVLLVEPNYKPGWDIPGGMSEANESPDQTVARELREELGLSLTVGAAALRRLGVAARPVGRLALLGIRWRPPRPAQIGALHVADPELANFEFCPHDTAIRRLNPRMARRFAAAWEALSDGAPPRYLVDGVAPE